MNMQEAIQDIRQSIDQIIGTSRQLPADLLHWKPAEDKWSVMEVLCHMDEAMPYWLDEIDRLAIQPGIEWGRGLQDEQRLAAVAGAGSRSPEDVLASIEKGGERVPIVLGPLTGDQLKTESPSRNPRFGTKPLSFVIQHLLVEHAAVHDRQIRRNIEQYHAAK